MNGRKLIGFVTAALFAGHVAAVAQSARVPTIGVLVLGSPSPETFLKIFREGLEQNGYVEGRNIRLELRSAHGLAGNLDQAAVELTDRKVDVIVAWQTPAVTAAQKATRDIPIVMAGAGNPVGTGLIASLARPGGNITGLSGVGAELAGKTLEVMREMLPAARRVAVLANATDPFTASMLDQIQVAAKNLGIEVSSIYLRPGDRFDSAFREARQQQVQGVFIQPTLLHEDAVELANSYRLPAFSFNKGVTDAGGLFAYAPNLTDQYRNAATYVDRILKGAPPGDLPVAQPTKFELIVNLKTAKALGITVPPSLLARADEVIE